MLWVLIFLPTVRVEMYCVRRGEDGELLHNQWSKKSIQLFLAESN